MHTSLIKVHNFVLARPEAPDDTMMLCGKRAHEGGGGSGLLRGGGGAGTYSLDFGPALACLEAFGVALAAFKHRPSLT